MSRPAIVLVDDEPPDLTALREVIARRYGGDYRIVPHLTAAGALAELNLMRSQGERVALVIADVWLDEMPGVELLGRAHALHPNAQRAILVPWGDRSASPAILTGCAFGQIDNYLQSPWDPPEVHLYPAVNEMLAEWTRAHGPRLELVRVVGDRQSPRVQELREVLAKSGIPHGCHDAGSEDGRRLLARAGLDDARLPIVLLPDGHALVQPTNAAVFDALGATDPDHARACDVVVVGAGPAGLTAAVYAASEGLRTVVVEREAVGGQAGASSLIRNFLGFPRGISGAALAQRAYQQAWLFDAKFVLAREVRGLERRDERLAVTLGDGARIAARAVIVATGAEYRRLGVASVERFVGSGVFYTTLVDGEWMADRSVAVVGGGNSAGQATTFLAKCARHVTLLCRGPSLSVGMSDYLVQQIGQLPNVDVRVRSEIVDGGGEVRLEWIDVADHAGGTRERLALDAVFVHIGGIPHTEWLAETLRRDAKGFVVTGRDLEDVPGAFPAGRAPLRYETSIPGVFAVGDVRAGSVKRLASAVGEAAGAIADVHEFLAARHEDVPATGR